MNRACFSDDRFNVAILRAGRVIKSRLRLECFSQFRKRWIRSIFVRTLPRGPRLSPLLLHRLLETLGWEGDVRVAVGILNKDTRQTVSVIESESFKACFKWSPYRLFTAEVSGSLLRLLSPTAQVSLQFLTSST